MPYAPDHRVETRSRILASARRLFNRNGLTEISIDKIMAGAGLTHGGFYKYFDSKEELYAEAITHFIKCGAVEPWQKMAFANSPQGADLARAILDAYLSREHLEDMEGSCPVIGLATDVARGGGAAKRAYRQVMEMMTQIFASNLGPNPLRETSTHGSNSQDTERALAVVALCVGGMVLARAVDDAATAAELRAAARRYAAALAGWDGAEERVATATSST